MTFSLSFLNDPRVQFLLNTLEQDGQPSLVVGGAARDGLRGETPKDIDIATKARPDDVARLFSDTDVTLHPTGIEHGTWTAVIDDLPVEITTFRRDVATDGRRATIAFADTFEEDAQRRDFTVNALGIDKTGAIHDPTNQGMDDLDARKIRFVGNAQERCDEDALRVLRLFRFQGRMGTWPMDKDALNAARDTSLSHISGERIWSELKGILQTPTAPDVLTVMEQTGVTHKILPNQGMNKQTLMETMKAEKEAGIEPHWARRLYALTNRTRFPWPMAGAEVKHLQHLEKLTPWHGNAKIAAAASQDETLGVDAWCLGKIRSKNPVEDAKTGANSRLPVQAKDFMEKGFKPSPALGAAMKKAHEQWLASGLAATKTDLVHSPHTREKNQER